MRTTTLSERQHRRDFKLDADLRRASIELAGLESRYEGTELGAKIADLRAHLRRERDVIELRWSA